MAYNNYPQAPFWDFVRGMDQNGAGVDHTPGQPFGYGPPPPPPPPPAFGAHPPPPHPFGAHPPPPPPGAFPGSFPFPGWGGSRGPFPGWFRGRGGFGGPGPHGRGGRRGHHCHYEHDHEHAHSGEEDERSRSRTASPNGGNDHPECEKRDGPSDGPGRGGRQSRGRHGRRGWGHHGRHGPPPAPFGGMGGFDMSALLNAVNSHPLGQTPLAQMLLQYAQQAGLTDDQMGQRSGETVVSDEQESTFTPPIDVFSTETAYVVHVALPGAKKEDVGVNWDAEKCELNIAGVVYRQGDEEFLKSLCQSERKTGVFERNLKLPPGAEEKEEVDGDAITAKMEDGVLVITVPKVEKEGWTEVKRVEIN